MYVCVICGRLWPTRSWRVFIQIMNWETVLSFWKATRNQNDLNKASVTNLLVPVRSLTWKSRDISTMRGVSNSKGEQRRGERREGRKGEFVNTLLPFKSIANIKILIHCDRAVLGTALYNVCDHYNRPLNQLSKLLWQFQRLIRTHWLALH